MLVPTVCYSCMYPIGDLEDLFRLMRANKVKQILAERGTVTTQVAIDTGLQLDCSDILDKLFVESYCCRTHLTTSMRFSDYY